MGGKGCTAQPVPRCWQHTTAAVGPIPIILALLCSFFPPVGLLGKEQTDKIQRLLAAACLYVFRIHSGFLWLGATSAPRFPSLNCNTHTLKRWSGPSYSVYIMVFLLVLWPSIWSGILHSGDVDALETLANTAELVQERERSSILPPLERKPGFKQFVW